MKPASILFFLILLISFLISLLFTRCSSNLDSPQEQIEISEPVSELHYPDNPFGVVQGFFENIMESESTLKNTGSSQKASGFLSDRSKLTLAPYSGPMAEKLARFAGVESFPDQGFHIMGVIDITEDQAWVETRWNYTTDHEKGIATVKTFYLVKENMLWKIEKII
jgi:hypothetical protein